LANGSSCTDYSAIWLFSPSFESPSKLHINLQWFNQQYHIIFRWAKNCLLVRFSWCGLNQIDLLLYLYFRNNELRLYDWFIAHMDCKIEFECSSLTLTSGIVNLLIANWHFHRIILKRIYIKRKKYQAMRTYLYQRKKKPTNLLSLSASSKPTKISPQQCLLPPINTPDLLRSLHPISSQLFSSMDFRFWLRRWFSHSFCLFL